VKTGIQYNKWRNQQTGEIRIYVNRVRAGEPSPWFEKGSGEKAVLKFSPTTSQSDVIDFTQKIEKDLSENHDLVFVGLEWEKILKESTW
jgi:hypothetical protein